jgi:uncharacterized protein (TIGR01777 family)
LSAQTILLAGGTGLIGSRLAPMLREKGHTVRILSRRPRRPGEFAWDLEKRSLDPAALEGVDAIVNLAGENLADGRWTAARKRRIVASRVDSARLLAAAVEKLDPRPQTYLSASGIGYYGDAGDRLLRETDEPVGEGFVIDVCRAWEQGAQRLATLGLRTVIFRIGLVLAAEGGALPELARPLRFGAGTFFADGQAWYSWIHRDDLCRAMIWALENPAVRGVYNAVAPEPARNRDFVIALARAMDRRVVPAPVPAFALRLALGQMADTVLASLRVSNEKIREAGFEFQHPELSEALKDAWNGGDLR